MQDSLSRISVILGNCFPRTFRLTSKKDIQSVFDQSQKAKRLGIIALFRPNESDHPRLGIIISKHQVKRAVDRNRLRRFVRESFRKALNTVAGFDIVIMLRSEWANFEHPHCQTELTSVWQQIAHTRNKADA